MTALFITLASCAAYLAVAVLAARMTYARVRPYSEPLNCDKCILCRPPHLTSYGIKGHCLTGRCWARPGGVSTPEAALSLALAGGLLWPGTLACLLLGHAAWSAITSGAPETAEEVAARIKRLERDLNIGDRP